MKKRIQEFPNHYNTPSTNHHPDKNNETLGHPNVVTGSPNEDSSILLKIV